MKKTAGLLTVLLIAVVASMTISFVSHADTVAVDSQQDNPVKGKMSQDDFPNPEDWEAYLLEHPEEGISLFGEWYPDTHMHVDVEKMYTIVGLTSQRVIQQFYMGGEYLYVTQRRSDEDGGVNSTMISRCTINEETKTATYKDRMILNNFGHGQTLEGYEYNGKMYFWISCKANTAYDNAWALQIGRMEYQAGKTISNYTSIPRFADLTFANKTGSSFGDVKRVDAALSTDGSRLLFWIQNVDNDIQYSIYRTDVLNAYLDVADMVSSKYISFENNNTLKSACMASFSQTALESVLPNGSNQGIELSDDGKIYIAGGNVGEIPQIAVMDNLTGSYTYSNLMTLLSPDFNDQSETEGIKLSHTGIYFGMVDHADQSRQYIYYFPYESIGQESIHSETEIRNAKEATCVAAGYSGDIYCSDCGELLKEGEEVPAKGHTWNAGVVTKAAQAAVKGNIRFTCAVCGTTEDKGIPATGIAPGKGTVITKSDIKYKITKAGLTGGTVECIGLAKSKSSVTIPKTISDQGITYKVTSIGAKAFYKNTKMTKVSIGSNVAKIGDDAFYKNTKLKTVSGGSGVTTIGKRAFYNSTKLEQAVFGSKLKQIGEKAFYTCKKLKSITMKSTKLTSKKIGSRAFYGIYSKAKINVPNSKKKAYKTLFRSRGIGKNVTVY